jgi:hypothetical protein
MGIVNGFGENYVNNALKTTLLFSFRARLDPSILGKTPGKCSQTIRGHTEIPMWAGKFVRAWKSKLLSKRGLKVYTPHPIWSIIGWLRFNYSLQSQIN